MKTGEYILLTGGAGYIGSHINKLISKKGYDTLIFDNLVSGHREHVKWGSFVLGDLSDLHQLRLLFGNYNIKAVMHFAAFSYVGESIVSPEKYYLNNVINTLNLLAVMRQFNVDRFVFSSTCAVYGEPASIPIIEDHPRDPINPYGRSKFVIENALADYSGAYGLKYVSLRYFNAAGADHEGDIGEWHSPETHLIPLVLDVAKGVRQNIEVFGGDYDTDDGTCIRDYIHVSDLAAAHLLAMEYLLEGNKSDVFNLGNANGCSVRQIIRAAERITGKEIKHVIGSKRPGDPARLIGSAEKAKKILNWAPRHDDIDEIIETAWKWHKNIQEKK